MGIVPLLGMAALVVDIGMLYRSRRNAQTAADAGALAYAWECFRFENTPGAGVCTNSAINSTANAALVAAATGNGYTNNTGGRAVSATATSWTAASSTWGTAPAVRVTVQDTVRSFFAGVFGRARTVVSARATATWSLAPTTGCVMALDPTATGALDVQGTPALSALNCGVIVNSNASVAASTGGNGAVTAGSIAITGGRSGSGFTPTPATGVPPALNPLADVTMPTVPSCTQTGNIDLRPNDTQSFAPATTGGTVVFCGTVSIKGSATLANGTYIFRRGLEVTSQGRLTGTDVTMINAPDGGCDVTRNNPECEFYVQAGSTINLSAATIGRGSLNGILFYQSAALPRARVWANSTTGVNGTFYFPNATLEMGGGAAMTLNGLLIADQIVLNGNATLTVNAPNTGSRGFFPGTRVTLVD